MSEIVVKEGADLVIDDPIASTQVIFGDGETVVFEAPQSIMTGGAGDVVGPASAIDRSIAVFDGTTGKLIKSQAPRISDFGNLFMDGGSITVDGHLISPGTGTESFKAGFNATADDYSVAIGRAAAAAIQGVSVGWGSDAAQNAVAIGYLSDTASDGIAIGAEAEALGGGIPTAIGRQAEASGRDTVALGFQAIASGDGGAAIGTNAVSGQNSETILTPAVFLVWHLVARQTQRLINVLSWVIAR
jgi:hypothetical protein